MVGPLFLSIEPLPRKSLVLGTFNSLKINKKRTYGSHVSWGPFQEFATFLIPMWNSRKCFLAPYQPPSVGHIRRSALP